MSAIKPSDPVGKRIIKLPRLVMHACLRISTVIDVDYQTPNLQSSQTSVKSPLLDVERKDWR